MNNTHFRSSATTLLLLMFLLPAGCSKDNGTPFDATLLNDGFKGITYTSVNGPDPTGPVDQDDWKSDGYWNPKYPVVPCSPSSAGKISVVVQQDTSVRPDPSPVPKTFSCSAAYPNPTNGNVILNFALERAAHIYCAVINDEYRTVAPLICSDMEAGYYSVYWDPKDEHNNNLPSDVYRCILLATDSQGNLLFSSHGDIWVKY
ncbi:MAG TPA: hypothetical protein VL633_12155 [Bacteroidota bacterium]|jgi:hypothetical protein|nr:hypothetical protein [Bacteroidota bacterium]